MLILGIESATPVASVALVDETGLLGEVTLNVGLTHSEQLLPMIDNLLTQCRRDISHITAIGASAGPGSFTGLRIGMATAKAIAQGLSWRGDKQSKAGAGDGKDIMPVLAIPTLEGMAWALAGQPVWISPMLNARRGQIYTALYQWQTKAGNRDTANEAEGMETAGEEALGEIYASRQRAKKDRLPADIGNLELMPICHIEAQAVSPGQWAERIAAYLEACPVEIKGDGQPVICLLGDGAEIYKEAWESAPGFTARILPPFTGLCRGSGIAFAAIGRMRAEGRAGGSPFLQLPQDEQAFYAMKPIYLRGV